MYPLAQPMLAGIVECIDQWKGPVDGNGTDKPSIWPRHFQNSVYSGSFCRASLHKSSWTPKPKTPKPETLRVEAMERTKGTR